MLILLPGYSLNESYFKQDRTIDDSATKDTISLEVKAALAIYEIYGSFLHSKKGKKSLPDKIRDALPLFYYHVTDELAVELCSWFNENRLLIEEWYKENPQESYKKNAMRVLQDTMLCNIKRKFKDFNKSSIDAIGKYGDVTRVFLDDNPLLQSILYPADFNKVGDSFLSRAKATDIETDIETSIETAIQQIIPEQISVIEEQLLPAAFFVVENLEQCEPNPLDLLAKSYLIQLGIDITKDQTDEYKNAYREAYRKVRENIISNMMVSNLMRYTPHWNTLKTPEEQAFFDLYVKVFQCFFFEVTKTVDEWKNLKSELSSNQTYQSALKMYKKKPRLGLALMESVWITSKYEYVSGFLELLLDSRQSSKTLSESLEYDTQDKKDISLIEKRFEVEGVSGILEKFEVKKLRVNCHGDKTNFYSIASNYLQNQPESKQITLIKNFLVHKKESIEKKSWFYPWSPFLVRLFNPKINKLNKLTKKIEEDIEQNNIENKQNYIDKATTVLGNSDIFFHRLREKIFASEVLLATEIFSTLRSFFMNLHIKKEITSDFSFFGDIEFPEWSCDHNECLKFYSSPKHTEDAFKLVKWVRENSNNILESCFWEDSQGKTQINRASLSDRIEFFKKSNIKFDSKDKYDTATTIPNFHIDAEMLEQTVFPKEEESYSLPDDTQADEQNLTSEVTPLLSNFKDEPVKRDSMSAIALDSQEKTLKEFGRSTEIKVPEKKLVSILKVPSTLTTKRAVLGVLSANSPVKMRSSINLLTQCHSTYFAKPGNSEDEFLLHPDQENTPTRPKNLRGEKTNLSSVGSPLRPSQAGRYAILH